MLENASFCISKFYLDAVDNLIACGVVSSRSEYFRTAIRDAIAQDVNLLRKVQSGFDPIPKEEIFAKLEGLD